MTSDHLWEVKVQLWAGWSRKKCLLALSWFSFWKLTWRDVWFGSHGVRMITSKPVGWTLQKKHHNSSNCTINLHIATKLHVHAFSGWAACCLGCFLANGCLVQSSKHGQQEESSQALSSIFNFLLPSILSSHISLNTENCWFITSALVIKLAWWMSAPV